MSNVDDNDLDNDGTPAQQTGSGLRAQLEAALAKNKAMEEQLHRLTRDTRQRTVADTLKELKAPEGLARFVNADLGDADVTSDAVKKWLGDNGGLFGWQPETEEPPADPAQTQRQQAMLRAAQAHAAAPASEGSSWNKQRLETASFEDLMAAGILPKDL